MAAATMSLGSGTGGAGVIEACLGVGGSKWRRGTGRRAAGTEGGPRRGRGTEGGPRRGRGTEAGLGTKAGAGGVGPGRDQGRGAGFCRGMFIFGWPGKGGGPTGWQQGSVHGPA